MGRSVSLRLLWLLPAALLFAAAGREVGAHRAVLARIARSHLPRAKVPPTVYGEHSGMAVALACLGLACIILALRRRRTAA
jgi:hypothetical protein